LLANHHDWTALKPRQTANDCLVIGIGPIAMQFFKVGKNAIDVVAGIRTLGMPGELRDLPWREIAENLFGQLPTFGLQPRELITDTHGAVVADIAKLFNLCLKLRNGTLKLKEIQIAERLTALSLVVNLYLFGGKHLGE
jgi:hypothetical protein